MDGGLTLQTLQGDTSIRHAGLLMEGGLTLLLSDQRCRPLLGQGLCAFQAYSGIAWRMIAATSCLQHSTNLWSPAIWKHDHALSKLWLSEPLQHLLDHWGAHAQAVTARTPRSCLAAVMEVLQQDRKWQACAAVLLGWLLSQPCCMHRCHTRLAILGNSAIQRQVKPSGVRVRERQCFQADCRHASATGGVAIPGEGLQSRCPASTCRWPWA